ncbi:MAG: hypothetical protein JWQ07_5503 [Ramlibacter sp.]|nr:hypothetical protein [Ramlibacter sp.]
MRRAGLDDGCALDLIFVKGDRQNGARRLIRSQAADLLQRLARKAIADFRAAFARHRAAGCALIKARASHMLGRQHREIGLDGVGECASGLLLLPSLQHSQIDEGTPAGAVLAAAAAALAAEARTLLKFVVSGGWGKARAVDDHAVSDH